MKITNLYNLPDAFTHLAEDGGRPPVPHVYHITELIEPVRMALLLRAHYDEITEDASDCVWLVFGQAAHKIMEEGNRKDYAEMPLSRECGTATVTGRLDLWDGETISDYKTSTVAKVQRQDFGDYFLQGMGYDWLLHNKAKRMRFVLLLKDWSPTQYRLASMRGDRSYPEHPVYVWEHEITEMERCDEAVWMERRVQAMESGELTPCTDEEKWHRGGGWAAMRKGGKRAVKICETEDEARQLTGIVERREGEDVRCQYYCPVAQWCLGKKGE
jgi:hypothetical protein